jgi:predicted Zn-dependent protease
MSEISIDRRVKWRAWVITTVSIILLAAAAFGGRRAYTRLQPQRLAEKAADYLEKGDYKNAALSAQRGLQINNSNLACSRVMAELTGKMGVPETVLWRRRVVQLNGNSTPDVLRWVAAAIQYHQYQVAQQALSKVPEAERNTAEFYGSAGAVAIGLGQATEAAKHFAEAARLEPTNETYLYNNATAQLLTGGAAARPAARATLEKLASSPRYQLLAKRVLISDASAHNELSEATARARELAAAPDATFGDHLTYLDLLQRTKAPEFDAALDELKKRAPGKREDAGALIGWLTQHGLNEAAITFAGSLDEETRKSGRVGVALAAAYEKAGDWASIQAFGKTANWGPYEHLRFAYMARALRELGDKNGAAAQWNAAITAAKSPEASKRLLQMLSEWKWENEIPTLLWASVKDSPDSAWALARLYRHYKDRGDTRGLHQVSARMMDLDPANEVLKNNYAMYSLLLGTNIESAFKTARENYSRNTSNPIAVTTYAFALHRKARSDEALALMNTLTAEQLEEPATALYYAVFLSANKAPHLAFHYLELAKPAVLLAEEKELVASLKSSLN